MKRVVVKASNGVACCEVKPSDDTVRPVVLRRRVPIRGEPNRPVAGSRRVVLMGRGEVKPSIDLQRVEARASRSEAGLRYETMWIGAKANSEPLRYGAG